MWNAHVYVAERIHVQSNVQMYLAKRIDACSGMHLCMWWNALMSVAECTMQGPMCMAECTMSAAECIYVCCGMLCLAEST
jgi:hypothetical protein